ncbi:wd-repeat protein, putative [Perkinsus marinus ATCC 50983]|uniref:Wd-repeat protein, putative n=1 Tax=Perkinsus marinus (strain ATCC 50983 / TXsc) TaxID=423536 RepID=C5KE35_PERM5|nr:wd-repeat protein, putative [Perkinsus marinus ATCC 50983]EER17247.1 wd-repeat protein, putative [Perkinsus marinus ATCC 50983]|eukprot:XP_002785451.1 wd-repeat protein, putative [Perkinsus marinus ATCC 50983]
MTTRDSLVVIGKASKELLLHRDRSRALARQVPFVCNPWNMDNLQNGKHVAREEVVNYNVRLFNLEFSEWENISREKNLVEIGRNKLKYWSPPTPTTTTATSGEGGNNTNIQYHQVVQFSSEADTQRASHEQLDSSEQPTEEDEEGEDTNTPPTNRATTPFGSSSVFISSSRGEICDPILSIGPSIGRSSSSTGMGRNSAAGYYITTATGQSLPEERLITPIFPDVIPVVVEDSQSSDEEARDYHHLSVPEDAWDAESCRVIAQDYSNDNLTGKSIFFGHRASANVVLVIGGDKPTTLHAHWEVLCSSFSYFQNMKDSRMRESFEGIAYFPTDSPRAWLTLLKRVYPPYRQLGFIEAVEVISLVDRLQTSWLSRELQEVLSDEAYGEQRTPGIADMLAAHGLSDVVAAWFSEKYWPALNAWRCVSECKDVKALRRAALYVCHEAASMKSEVEQLRKTLRDVKMESRGRQNRISRMKSAGANETVVDFNDTDSRILTPKFVVSPGIKSGRRRKVVEEYIQPAEVFCVRFSPDNTLLAVSTSNGLIKIYNCRDGKEIYTLQSPRTGEVIQPVTQIRWRPMGSSAKTQNVLVSVNAEGVVSHWHVTSASCMHEFTEDGNQLFCVDYSPDGSQFATAGRERGVAVYDENTKALITTLKGGDSLHTPGHSNRVFSLKYHPEDPNVIITGGWDNTVQFWDIRKGHSVRSIFGPHICGDSVDITNDGKRILTGSWRVDRQLQIWDYAEGTLIEDIPWRSGASVTKPCMLYAAQFNKGHRSGEFICAGGSGANEAKILHNDKGSGDQSAGWRTLGTLTGVDKGCFTVDFSSGKSTEPELVAVGGGDGIVRVMEIGYEENEGGDL